MRCSEVVCVWIISQLGIRDGSGIAALWSHALSPDWDLHNASSTYVLCPLCLYTQHRSFIKKYIQFYVFRSTLEENLKLLIWDLVRHPLLQYQLRLILPCSNDISSRRIPHPDAKIPWQSHGCWWMESNMYPSVYYHLLRAPLGVLRPHMQKINTSPIHCALHPVLLLFIASRI